jgi:hypothetical protein
VLPVPDPTLTALIATTVAALRARWPKIGGDWVYLVAFTTSFFLVLGIQGQTGRALILTALSNALAAVGGVSLAHQVAGKVGQKATPKVDEAGPTDKPSDPPPATPAETPRAKGMIQDPLIFVDEKTPTGERVERKA